MSRPVDRFFTALQLACGGVVVFTALHPERFPTPLSVSRVLLYLAFPALFAGALQLARRFSSPVKANILLSLASLLTCLWLAELALVFRLVAPRKITVEQPAEIARVHGVPFDSRTLHEVVLGLRKAGKAAYPNGSGVDFVKTDGIAAGNGRLFPLGWISRQHVVYCNESGTFSAFNTDEHGFRNPPGLYRPGLDLLLVGDSFTEGACVPDGSDLGSRLRLAFPRTLNLGKGGHGPPSQLATLREYGPPLRPRIVLWFVFDNDLRNIIEQQESPLLMRYLGDPAFTQNLIGRQPEIDKALRAYVDAEYAKLGATPSMPAAPAEEHPPPSGKNILKLTALRQLLGVSAYEQLPPGTRDIPLEHFLSAANATVSEWGGKLYVVYLPGFFRPGGHPSAEEANPSHPVVIQAVERAGLPLIDLFPDFVAHPDVESLFPFRTGAHYAPDGYGFAAQRILAKLPSAHEAAAEGPRHQLPRP